MYVLYNSPVFQLQVHFKKIFYLFIFRERRREGERGEKHPCVRETSHTPPTGDLASNPGMGSDLWICRMMPNPPNHTSQGQVQFSISYHCYHFFCILPGNYLPKQVCTYPLL